MEFQNNSEDQEAFLRYMSELAMEDDLSADEFAVWAHDLEEEFESARSIEEISEAISKLLYAAGTDIQQNEDDPYGDGDQSMLVGKNLESRQQILRNLFATGGDFHFYRRGNGLTDFAFSCVKGDVKAVEASLRAAATKDDLVKLLEVRQTSMRLSPLLLTLAFTKQKHWVADINQCNVDDMDHMGVFRTLIRYGARPDAKDVTGKTSE